MPILTQPAFYAARNAIREAVVEAGWVLNQIEEIADVSYDCVLVCTRWKYEKPPAGATSWLPGWPTEQETVRLRVREGMSLGDTIKAIQVRLKLS